MSEDEPNNVHPLPHGRCIESSPVMCERCGVRTADIVVNLRFLVDDTTFPVMDLCASCFLIVVKSRPDVSFS